MEFTLGFKEFIGKRVTLIDESGYHCGDYVQGRYYSGKFEGTINTDNSILFLVDGKEIKVSNTTKIKFSE